jgi:6-pyruvoyltetrahydropterin/6-carboxytetrahydropterin synthase
MSYATVIETFVFDAAHVVPCVPEGHKCGRLHGHTWRAEVHVYGEVDPKSGIVVDYYDIRAAWAPLDEALDHRFLNEVPGLALPTSENIARWIWDRLKPALPGLTAIVLHEGASARCEYRGA